MDFRQFLIACVVTISGSASASTVFAPTDGNVNFLNETITFDALTQLAIFNVGDLAGANRAIALNDTRSSAVASFTDIGGGDWGIAIKPNEASGLNYDNMTLFGSDNFILGLSTDGGTTWAPDTGAVDLGGDIFRVSFSGGQLIEIDVRVVPLPAAIWLLGSGVLGMGLLARRRA